MNEELNLVEVLKDCPKGTRLYSPICGEVEFVSTSGVGSPIEVVPADIDDYPITFLSDGRYADFPNAECMLFPSRDNRDWSTFVVPKSLPKTWMEFCQMHDVQPDEAYINNESIVCVNGREGIRLSIDDRNLLPNKKTAKAMLALCQLLQLRDCYNDGWVPDWKNHKYAKFCIYIDNEEISTATYLGSSEVLSFKNKELRQKFLENFRDLIETAKPLL